MTLFIDGLDEALSPAMANRLAIEARSLAVSRGRVVATSRLFHDGPERERLGISPLTSEQGLALVNLASERAIGSVYDLPAPVRDSIVLPLFALLVGSALRDEQHPHGNRWDIVRSVANRALRAEFGAADASTALLIRKIAVRQLNDGRPPVLTHVCPTHDGRTRVLGSRLVIERMGRVEFPLPLMGRWFGAEALMAREVSATKVVQTPDRAARWADSLSIALSGADPSLADDMFAQLVAAAPGAAARRLQSIDEHAAGVVNWPRDELPAREWGEALRDATARWCAALAPLSASLVGITHAGQLRPLRIQTGPGVLSTAWHDGSADAGAEATFILGLGSRGRSWTKYGYHPGTLGRWKWALEQIADEARRRLNARALLDGPELRRERMYLNARLLSSDTGRHRDISVSSVVGAIDRLLSYGTDSIQVQDGARTGRFDRSGLTAWRSQLTEDLQHGRDTIPLPHPGSDRTRPPGPSAWIWDFYSHQRIFELAVDVFTDALRAYEQSAAPMLSSLHGYTSLSTRMPCTLLGVVHRPRSGTGPTGIHDGAVGPWIDYWARPGSSGPSTVRFVLAPPDRPEMNWRATDSDIHWTAEQLGMDESELHQLQWGMRDLSFLFHDAPVTDLVYEWLEFDLKTAGLLKA
jgi:hypothetical protein